MMHARLVAQADIVRFPRPGEDRLKVV